MWACLGVKGAPTPPGARACYTHHILSSSSHIRALDEFNSNHVS
jgi:hypothetical protein